MHRQRHIEVLVIAQIDGLVQMEREQHAKEEPRDEIQGDEEVKTMLTLNRGTC